MGRYGGDGACAAAGRHAAAAGAAGRGQVSGGGQDVHLQRKGAVDAAGNGRQRILCHDKACAIRVLRNFCHRRGHRDHPEPVRGLCGAGAGGGEHGKPEGKGRAERGGQGRRCSGRGTESQGRRCGQRAAGKGRGRKCTDGGAEPEQLRGGRRKQKV